MMITYLETTLFDSPAQTLVNTVNTAGVMGKGIALVFKRLYPEMYNEYRKLCEENKFGIGMLYIYRTPNKIIVNFPTKKHWRYPSKIEYIEAGLKKFVERYPDYGVSSVSFPQLGCGHGELNWEKQVQPVMERYLKDLPIPVYIHLYPQVPDFVPERLDETYARQVRLERQRISIDKLWQDLQQIADEGSGKPYQMSLFGPSVRVQEEYIVFSPTTANPITIYREDIEDLWNVLRIRGTISEADIPESIRAEGAIDWLFELLGRLEYIRPVQIRKRGEMEYARGLQYAPQPELAPVEDVGILV
jgi:O-acetyl-ADP-ribose deacetylase (regulator of RNase III)